MTGFTFSAEEVRLAPLAVRQWIEAAVTATLRASIGAHQEAVGHSEELAACSAEEALQIFQMIRQDLAAILVFLELAHEPIGTASPSIYALDIGEIVRHTRLAVPRVAQSFVMINQIFQRLRKDPQAALFGFDQANHVYMHATTHRSIRSVWEGLVQMGAQPMATATAPIGSAPGLAPPQVETSEDIAAHNRP